MFRLTNETVDPAPTHKMQKRKQVFIAEKNAVPS